MKNRGPKHALTPSWRVSEQTYPAMSTSEWAKQVAVWADEWHGDLIKYARRTSTRADAQDLAQEVYLRRLRVDRTDLVRRPRSYLLRIAANALDDWRLKAQQARPHGSAALDTLRSADDPELTAIGYDGRPQVFYRTASFRPSSIVSVT
jgi:DNA-directed RNA polymerase specialized sigma24 family protein